MKHILDAGPLIAALNRQDEHHRWACETLQRLGVPFYSCSEALAEVAAMTRQPSRVVEMVDAGEIVIAFSLADQTAAVLALLRKYEDQQMDLADACIVRMTELIRDSCVVTLDRADFSIYRRNSRQVIPIICPS